MPDDPDLVAAVSNQADADKAYQAKRQRYQTVAVDDPQSPTGKRWVRQPVHDMKGFTTIRQGDRWVRVPL